MNNFNLILYDVWHDYPESWGEGMTFPEAFDHLMMRLDWVKVHLEDLDDGSIDTILMVEYMLNELKKFHDEES